MTTERHRHLRPVPGAGAPAPADVPVPPEQAAPAAAQRVLTAARTWFVAMLEAGELDGLSLALADEARLAMLALADAVSSYEHQLDRLRDQGPAISG